MSLPPLGLAVGKTPLRPYWLLKVQLTLTALQLLLLADVLPHPSLVQPDRAHAVPRCPEVEPRHPTLVKQLGALLAVASVPLRQHTR